MDRFNVSLIATAVGAAVIAALVTGLLVPVVRRLALSMRAVDYPGGRREHASAIPRLGGPAILAGLFFGVGSMVLVQWPSHGGSLARSQVLAWVIGVSLVFLVGLIEDLSGLSSAKRFIFETVAAVIVVATGWQIGEFSLPVVGPVELGWAAPILTVLWIVGVTNAINLLDGLDGLAAGVIAIIAGSLIVIALWRSDVFSAILLAGVVGACFGFLRHNWAPATIFMGDAGSLTLGFVLGTMTVHGSIKSSAAVTILVPILALGVPVIDTLIVMMVRFLEKPRTGWRGRVTGMFTADRNHLHHVLHFLQPKRQAVLGTIYMLVLASCCGALIVSFTKNATIGILLVAVEIVAILLIRRFGFAQRARTIGVEHRRELMRDVKGSVGEERARAS